MTRDEGEGDNFILKMCDVIYVRLLRVVAVVFAMRLLVRML